MDGDKKFRVYNRCKYDIGVNLLSGVQANITAGNFIRLSVDDILHIEGTSKRKIFSAKMLVPVDDNGKDVDLETIGGYPDTYATPHLSDEEIEDKLSKSAKAISAWLDTIEEPEELHAVFEVAKHLDLPASKLKVLQAKLPTKDMLEDDE